MRTHQTMLAILICTFMSHATATTSHSLDADATPPAEAFITKDPLDKVKLSEEEAGYISEECQRFAMDDEVNDEQLPDYLSLCVHELTIAVKTALLQRQIKRKRQIEAIETGSHSRNKPKPM